MSTGNGQIFLDATDARALAKRIGLEFPNSSRTVLPIWNGKYAVEIEAWTLTYSQYSGLEYDEFLTWAELHGFEVDTPRTDYLVQPVKHTLVITTPGQWDLILMMENYKSLPERRGRPRKAA